MRGDRDTRRAALLCRAFLILAMAIPETARGQLGPGGTDALRLQILKFEIERAEAEASATSFWHRIIPRVSVAASFGLHNVFFVDPATYEVLPYPRDAYRLSFSLSLNELLASARHDDARLRVMKLRMEYELAVAVSVEAIRRRERTISLLGVELRLKEEVARFDSLRFQQGSIGYNVFVESKLAALRIRKQFEELEADAAGSEATGE